MENRFLYIILFTAMLFSCSLTPKYAKQLHIQFDLDISKDKISVIKEKEKWGPNGDGFYLAILSFKSKKEIQAILKQRKFNSLPIKENLPVNEIYRQLNNLQNGYYLFEVDQFDPGNFRIVTLDPLKNEMIFYYQLY